MGDSVLWPPFKSSFHHKESEEAYFCESDLGFLRCSKMSNSEVWLCWAVSPTQKSKLVSFAHQINHVLYWGQRMSLNPACVQNHGQRAHYTYDSSMHKMWLFTILKPYFHHKNVKQIDYRFKTGRFVPGFVKSEFACQNCQVILVSKLTLSVAVGGRYNDWNLNTSSLRNAWRTGTPSALLYGKVKHLLKTPWNTTHYSKILKILFC